MMGTCFRRRFLPALLAALVAGVVAGAGLTPAFAHKPIVTRPRVLVLQAGESAAIVLEMINVAGPGEPREDVETVFAVVPAGVSVMIADPIVPSEQARRVEAALTTSANVAAGVHQLVFEARGVQSGLVLANGILELLIPPEPAYVGPVTAAAASVFLRADPQRFVAEEGVAAGRLFVLNATGASLRVEVGGLPDDVEADVTVAIAEPGLSIVEVTIRLGPGFVFEGAILVSPVLIDASGAVVATTLFFVSAPVAPASAPSAAPFAPPGPPPAESGPESGDADTLGVIEADRSDGGMPGDAPGSAPADALPAGVAEADVEPVDPTDQRPASADLPATASPDEEGAQISDGGGGGNTGLMVGIVAGVAAVGVLAALAFGRRRRSKSDRSSR